MLALIPLLTVPPLALRSAPSRPDLSGDVLEVEVQGFRFHYTTSGRDSASPADVDQNGIPDVIDEMADALTFAEQTYEAEGWRGLSPDDGAGGSPAIDVYLQKLDINGYALPVPGSDEGGSCLMALDPTTPTAGDVLRSVAVHELHHCVQFRYAIGLPSWLYESASTFEQYDHVESPALAIALGVLYVDELTTPERSITSEALPNDPYTTFLWSKFWSENGLSAPALDRLPAMWEALARPQGGWRVRLDAASREAFGVPLAITFLRYATYNRFACAADDGAHYVPDALPCIAEATVPVEPVSVGEPVVIQHEEGPLTAHYLDVAIDAPGWVDLVCTGDDVYTHWLRWTGREVAQSAVGLSARAPARLWMNEGDVGRAVVVGTQGRLDTTCEAVPVAATTPTSCTTPPAGGKLAGVGAVVGLLLLRRRRSLGQPEA